MKSIMMLYILTNLPIENSAVKFSNTYFLNEKDWIPIKFQWSLFPNGTIDNKSAMVQVMSWRQTGNKPFTCTNADPVHRCIYVRH